MFGWVLQWKNAMCILLEDLFGKIEVFSSVIVRVGLGCVGPLKVKLPSSLSTFLNARLI